MLRRSWIRTEEDEFFMWDNGERLEKRRRVFRMGRWRKVGEGVRRKEWELR